MRDCLFLFLFDIDAWRLEYFAYYWRLSTWEKDLKKTARSDQVVDPARSLRGTSVERNDFVPDHETFPTDLLYEMTVPFLIFNEFTRE